MTRVLLVWEDKYFETLHTTATRLLRAVATESASSVPTIVSHTARGNGVFERYVQTTWPKARSAGVPGDPRPFHHLVCIVDGDKLHELLRGHLSRPPTASDDVLSWHEGAERAWQTYLHERCPADGPPISTVHGVVLRWSRESVALAGYDQAAARTSLGLLDGTALTTVLAKCTPDPRTVPTEHFTESFRRPLECLRLLRGGRVLDKTAPEIDDAIKALGKHSLDVLRTRVPDLARIADLVWRLHGAAT